MYSVCIGIRKFIKLGFICLSVGTTTSLGWKMCDWRGLDISESIIRVSQNLHLTQHYNREFCCFRCLGRLLSSRDIDRDVQRRDLAINNIAAS